MKNLLTLLFLSLAIFTSAQQSKCCCDHQYKFTKYEGDGHVYFNESMLIISSFDGYGNDIYPLIEMVDDYSQSVITLSSLANPGSFAILTISQSTENLIGSNITFHSSVVMQIGQFSEADFLCLDIDFAGSTDAVIESKKYTCSLTQSGTDDPIITEQENTCGINPYIVRISEGRYEMYFVGIDAGANSSANDIYFSYTDNSWFLMQWNIDMKCISYGPDAVFEIYTSIGGTPYDGLFYNTPLEFRFY